MKLKTMLVSVAAATMAMTFSTAAVSAEPALVFGHKAPDTDTIVSAMAAAHLLQKRGIDAVAVAQGKLNPETAYVQKRFGFKDLPIIDSVEGKDYYIVDFAELGQGPDDMKDCKKCNLRGIFDHHKLGDVSSAAPLEVWMMPLGSAATVIKNAHDFYGVKIPKELAGPMVAAILSDTVILQSPTTTDQDRKAVQELAKIAGVKDVKALGMEMFKAKSDLNAPAPALVKRDYKEYDMGKNKVGIGQLELVSLDLVTPKQKAELLKAMEAMKAEGRSAVVLLLTDIITKGSEILVVADNKAEILKTLKADEKGWAKGVMSRKKQVVPPLQKMFAN